MFLNLASHMKLLLLHKYYHKLVLHKEEITFTSSVSILKSFANDHFLKVVIDTVSF